MPEVTTDLRIHYRVVGAGPPILWHNGGCGDGRMWELGGYVDAFPDHTHVLLDHRGRGRSESPIDLAGHHMSRYVTDVLAVLDDAGMGQAAFVGYSLGGAIGYDVALAAPHRLSALVTLDAIPDPEGTPEQARAEAEAILARGTRAVIEEMAEAEAEPVPGWMLDHLCETSTLSLAGTTEANATAGDVWGRAATIDVPVLLVLGVGPEDQDWWELGQRLAEALPRGRASAVEGAQHLAAFHRSDLTLPPIRAFLEEVTPGT